jgi:hypothetical protein
MWFEVAIIEGNTPFLLSASFLKRIGVIIDIEKKTLWSGALERCVETISPDRHVSSQSHDVGYQ